MKHVIDTVQNQFGDPIQGVAVNVTMFPSNSTAVIFSDNGITQATNPVYTDAQGMYSFYAANGRYNLSFSGQGTNKETITDILIDDPSEAYAYKITGGTIDATPIGSITPTTGSFTTLTVSSLSLSSVNNTPIGNTTPNTGVFTNLSSTNLTVSGTADLTASNATLASNSNALLSSTWASPGAIGSTTPNAGTFTTLNSSGITALGVLSATSINNTPIGASTSSTGKFTTLIATNLDGAIIGGSTPQAGTFTTLNATSGINTTNIGATVAGTGKFTTLQATSGLNSTAVGNTTASSGVFTTLQATSGLNSTTIGNTTPSTGKFTALSTGITTVTGSSYTVGTGDTSIIFNTSATCSVTLPSAASFTGRILMIKTIAAFAINSATSNVAPQASSTLGTAILAATAGKFATLQSDGTSWIIMMSN